MRLNHFVFRDGDQLVNLTTKTSLPLASSISEFKSGLFLEGQEEACVGHRLFGQSPSTFTINVIPTWECNLRCGHCFVLHELRKKDPGRVDSSLLSDFVSRLFKSYPDMRSGQIHFVGGEPTLRSTENLELMARVRESVGDKKIIFTATSNAFDCDDKALEFLSSLDSLIVSIDGSKDCHDAQRKPLDRRDLSPFDDSLRTIRRLVAAGRRDSLTVQASLPEESMNMENLVDMYKHLLMSGVKYEKIIVGFVAPTRQRPNPDGDFLRVVTRAAHVKPCCKYRLMSNFVVDTSNRVFCDYFDVNSDNLLGDLSDPIESIAAAHERVIRSTMPVLNDPKCAKCPVIGLCWGWCANTKCLKPSDHCDPDTLLKRVRQNAEKGNLRNFLKNTKDNDLSDEGNQARKCCGGDSCR